MFTTASVSVIIPIYNVESYLQNLINTLSEQVSSWIEFILIDDGSSDNSLEILEKIPNNCHFRIVEQSNQGVAAARNHGLTIAQGEYVCFIDPDDTINDHYFEELYTTAVESRSDLVLCNWAAKNQQHLTVHNLKKMKNPMNVQPSIVFSHMLGSVGILTGALWGKLFKKSLFCNNTFPNQKTNSDYVACFTAVGLAKRIAYCYSATYYYTVDRSTSLQHSQSISDLEYLVSTRNELVSFVVHHFPEHYDLALSCYIKVILEACSRIIESKKITDKKTAFNIFRKKLFLHKSDLNSKYLSSRERLRCFATIIGGFQLIRALSSLRKILKF